MFVCDDDIYHPDFISNLVPKFEDHEVKLSYCTHNLFNGANFTLPGDVIKYTNTNSKYYNSSRFLIFRNCIPIFFGIYKVESLIKSMKYFIMVDSYGFNHENLMIFHFLLNNKISFTDQRLFTYFEKERNILYKDRGYKVGINVFYSFIFSIINNFNFSKIVFSLIISSDLFFLQKIKIILILAISFLHRTFYKKLLLPIIKSISN